ncbi:hypothetical protein Ahy_A07g033970 [Arachis hypogaea]|uniref:Uncharacterized protein n=1 Tax=Arachis hypogaea TaxID=3818 RepID=A0A445CAM6_ARAHY|nr:hypothetical protein Ahy_A07g033970 [Arachis hypogaea]
MQDLPENDDIQDQVSDSLQLQPEPDPPKPTKLSEGDHIHVGAHPFMMDVLRKQGDQAVLFADKSEIITAFVEATIKASDYELEVVSSNKFEYNAAADLVKELEFEEVEGGVKTRIFRK